MSDPIVNAVKETCILAGLKFSALGLTRTDKAASRKVAADSGAVEGSARVVVSRLAGADHHHRAITGVQNLAKQVLHGKSMPYGTEDTWRLLPNRQFEPLLIDLNVVKRTFDKCLEDLRNDAPNIIAMAKANIGTLDVEVPTVDELINAYSMETEFRPVPDSRSFANLPEVVSAKLSRHLDASVAAAFEKAQNNTLERFIPPLEHFIARMQKYEEREKAIANGEEPGRVGAFNNSVVSNIKELYEVLSDFNVAGDERMVELGNQLASLATVDPDTLRKNPEVRTAAQKRARDTVAALNDWLTPTSASKAA